MVNRKDRKQGGENMKDWKHMVNREDRKQAGENRKDWKQAW
jgi:hypothetical protein